MCMYYPNRRTVLSIISAIKKSCVILILLTVACKSLSYPKVASTPPATSTSTSFQTITLTYTPAPKKTLSPTRSATQSRTPAAHEPDPQEIITLKANEVVLALKNLDMDSLSTFVHPKLGVRFSPYAFVRDTDLVFSAEQVKGLLADNSKYFWGYADGSGLPIHETFKQYYHRFIYDKDFVHADEVAYNQRLGLGNMIDNSKDFYPESNIVEYYFPGFDPNLSGMDWRSLLLVFQEEAGTWYLVGIIHGEWTT